MSNSKDIAGQLVYLRANLFNTGALHDAQLQQLKLWPKIVYGPGVKFELGVDIENRVVQYWIDADSAKVPDETSRYGLNKLEEAIKWLLDFSDPQTDRKSNWALKVDLGGKEVWPECQKTNH